MKCKKAKENSSNDKSMCKKNKTKNMLTEKRQLKTTHIEKQMADLHQLNFDLGSYNNRHPYTWETPWSSWFWHIFYQKQHSNEENIHFLLVRCYLLHWWSCLHCSTHWLDTLNTESPDGTVNLTVSLLAMSSWSLL